MTKLMYKQSVSLDPRVKDFRYTPWTTFGTGGIAALIAYLRAKRRGDSLGKRVGSALKWGAGVGALGYLGGQAIDHLYWRPKNLADVTQQYKGIGAEDPIKGMAALNAISWIANPRWYDLVRPPLVKDRGIIFDTLGMLHPEFPLGEIGPGDMSEPGGPYKNL